MYDGELLRAFVGVAEDGGFTRAAQRLHLTQSAVSAQIKRLELEVGCALLTRSTRSVALTPQGEILLEYARRILALHEDIRKRLGPTRRIGGHVRVGAAEGFLGGWLADLLQRFTAEYPAVTLELHVGITDTLLETMREGRLDIVLGIACGAVGADEIVWSEQLVWAFSDRATVDRSRPLPLSFFPEPCPYREAALAALKNTRTQWRLACMSPSAAGLRASASLGLGVTPLLRSQLEPGLKDVGKELGLPPLPVADFAIWRGPKSRSATLNSLREAIQSGARRGVGARALIAPGTRAPAALD
jgi:DNA-binding transcriptional LysR family regulator